MSSVTASISIEAGSQLGNKRRVMDAEGYQALKDKVDKLLINNFIKESFYPSWLANPILVKKPNGK